MSMEVNFEKLESLSIADLYTISELYTIKLENTNNPQEIFVFNQVIEVCLKQLNIKLKDIFIF